MSLLNGKCFHGFRVERTRTEKEPGVFWVYEWRPKGKRPAPDVTKGVANA